MGFEPTTRRLKVGRSTTELQVHKGWLSRMIMEDLVGFEPTTRRLRVGRSTAELQVHKESRQRKTRRKQMEI